MLEVVRGKTGASGGNGLNLFLCKCTERRRLPFVGAKNAGFQLCQCEKVKRFVLGSNHTPARQRGDDIPHLQIGEIGVAAAMQFAAQHLWMQAKNICQFLLGIATCTKVVLYAGAKCHNIQKSPDFHNFSLRDSSALCSFLSRPRVTKNFWEV